MKCVLRTFGQGVPWVAIPVLLATCDSPRSPMICGAIPEQSVVAGEAATVNACFEDPDGDPLRLVASSSDPAIFTASILGTTVTVTGVSPGTGVVTITATDPTDLQSEQQFRVVVPNRAPVAVGEIASRELTAGESVSLDVSANFSEPDGQPLSYAVSVSGEGIVELSAAGPVLTLDALAKGTVTVTATASDPGGLSAIQEFRGDGAEPEAGCGGCHGIADRRG